MYVYMQMTKIIKPYDSEMLNNMDTSSSLASMLTVIIGMFYLEKSSKENDGLLTVLFVFLIFINLCFLLNWIFQMAPLVV